MQLPGPVKGSSTTVLYFIRPAASETVDIPSITATPTSTQEGPSLRDYWRIIAKHRRIIVLPVICALALASVVVSLMTPTYTAHSTILVERQTPQVLDIRQPGTEQSDEFGEDDFYGTQYKILESRSLAARVIRDLNLEKLPLFAVEGDSAPARRPNHSSVRSSMDGAHDLLLAGGDGSGEFGIQPKVIDAYLGYLGIRPEPGTRLVRVSFGTPDPALSARIVNAHVQAYIARGTELRSQASQSAERFLGRKLAELKARVEQSEAALNSYRRTRGIIADASDDKTRVVMDRLLALNKALTEAETERIGLAAQVDLLDAKDYNALPAVANEPLIQALKQELAKVEAERASLASEYKPEYPPLQQVDARRGQLEARLNREIRRVAGRVKLSYQASVAREQGLRERFEAEKERALALNDASLQDAILARAVETNRELYKNVLARMSQMGMAAGISASNVSVVDAAQPPVEPSSPKKAMAVGFSGLLSLFFGIACAFMLERVDDGFKDPQEVECSLGIPSLGVVPDFRKLGRATRSDSRCSVKPLRDRSANGMHLPAKSANTELMDGLDSFALANEAYRAIRVGILLSRAEVPPKVILITSGSPEEGKTVTAINTAIVFARMGERVLLIDADLRLPRCHQILQIPRHPGVTEILTGNAGVEEAVRPTGVEGLSCITAGVLPPSPGELLGSRKMAELLSDLRKKSYDCILIDSAPLMPVADSLLLSTVVDGVVLVVGPRTSKGDVRQACSRLLQIRAKVLGVVLNRFPVADHYYRHYYHYRASAEVSNPEERAG